MSTATLTPPDIAGCNALHEEVQSYATQARWAAEVACYLAVLLGIRLRAIQQRTPHGQWQTLFEKSKTVTCDRFDFSVETARRYMRAAEGALSRPGLSAAAKGRILRAAAGGALTSNALSDEDKAALDAATRGATLRQLYIDLGIIRAGATERWDMGGNKRTGPKPFDEQLDLWETITTSLNPISSLAESGDLARLDGPRLTQLEQALRGLLDVLSQINRAN